MKSQIRMILLCMESQPGEKDGHALCPVCDVYRRKHRAGTTQGTPTNYIRFCINHFARTDEDHSDAV